MNKLIILLAFLTVTCESPTSLVLNSADAAEKKQNIVVIDGDTIKLNGARIRLHGIDAPESNQICIDDKGIGYPCGKLSKMMLKFLTNDKIICDVKGGDKYKRTISVCYNSEGKDINQLMVATGMAIAYREYSNDYIVAEQLAKKNKYGIWVGEFVNPSDYRKGKKRK